MKGYITRGRVDGTWYLRAELPRSADGKRQQRRETIRGTKAEAQRRLREFLREVETGVTGVERLTVAAIAKRWLDSTEHRVGVRTFQRYRQLVEDFIIPAIGALRADAVRAAHVDAAVATWRTRKSEKTGRVLTDRSIRHTFDTTRALCRWAVRMGLLVRNPCDAVTPPRWEQREMSTLDERGLGALLSVARGTELEIPIVVLVGTGLRRGEAFGLRWSDIDFDRARLTVRRSIEVVDGKRREKPPKTARSARNVALAPFVVDILRRQKREQCERRLLLGLGRDEEAYVFDRGDATPWDPDLFGWRFAYLVRQHKLPKIRLHDLRHSYATFMLAAGVDLKSISTSLGHSTIAVTANTYAHVSDSLHQQNADRLDVALRAVVGESLSGDLKASVPQRCHAARQNSKKPRGYRVSLVAPTGFEPVLPP